MFEPLSFDFKFSRFENIKTAFIGDVILNIHEGFMASLRLTQRAHDVNITSPQRRCNVTWRCIDVEATLYLHDVASTLRRRYIYVIRLNVDATSHDVASTLRRRYIYMTLHRRWGDVIFTSCARWDNYICKIWKKKKKIRYTTIFNLYICIYNFLSMHLRILLWNRINFYQKVNFILNYTIIDC